MTATANIPAFSFSHDDPLAAEHAVVSEWVEAGMSEGNDAYYRDWDLKCLPIGQRILAASPAEARRYVMAALVQIRHWDSYADGIRNQAESETSRINPHSLPGWNHFWGRLRLAEAVVSTLMKRALPLQREDLLQLLDWCEGAERLSSYHAPISSLAKALERYHAKNECDAELADAMSRYAANLRAGYGKDTKRYGTIIEQLCADYASQAGPETASRQWKPRPVPAMAGSPTVMRALKKVFRMLMEADTGASSTVLEPDHFPLDDDSCLREEHELLSDLLSEVTAGQSRFDGQLKDYPSGKKIEALSPEATGRLLLTAAERTVYWKVGAERRSTEDMWAYGHWVSRMVPHLALRPHVLSREQLFDWILYLSTTSCHEQSADTLALLTRLESEITLAPLSEGERYVLSVFRRALIGGPPLGAGSATLLRISNLVEDGAIYFLVPGEKWADGVNDTLSELTGTEREKWATLLRLALTANAAKPSAKWLANARKVVEEIGEQKISETLVRWFSLVSQGRTVRNFGSYVGDARGAGDVIHDENANCLRGLLWLVQLLPKQEALARAVTAVALSAYRKVPGVGPRAVKVGNAAVYALAEMGTMDAVGQLAMLKIRIKFGTAQKEIEKAFNAAAEALALPRDQIEEMGVPSYGLEDVGIRKETLGEYRVELLVTGSDASLSWFDGKGKQLKSVPAKVKSEHGDDLKELQQSLKDIQSMLPAQRDRIDSMFLSERTWPVDVWSERYLNHPLVGTIVRRLIWCVDGAPAVFIDGQPKDIEGKLVEHGTTAEISLWHPVGRSVEEITAWRQKLEELQITQPFKQAHREIYLLTDAERNTRTYSNRFAAHVLRQHQFNALCGARGWKNRLRLMVDDEFPPAAKELEQWGLRAEFWVEGIGDEYGGDTNDSGVYLRLATDQVRFYRIGAAQNSAHAGGGGYSANAIGPGRENVNEPLSLDQVPALVFSEVMRDVDLFVGVASVGNDPAWQDGGPEGRYRTYWENYSFGELNGTAATRKQVLERLVPRLKISDRCSFEERFLVVRGDKRTYKIHLGSGNILMEPNDQYLCIVPDARARSQQGDLFLPFEGDNTLSIIISKALMLAADIKIKDPTITRQIEGK